MGIWDKVVGKAVITDLDRELLTEVNLAAKERADELDMELNKIENHIKELKIEFQQNQIVLLKQKEEKVARAKRVEAELLNLLNMKTENTEVTIIQEPKEPALELPDKQLCPKCGYELSNGICSKCGFIHGG
jgi:TolA-binding protein